MILPNPGDNLTVGLLYYKFSVGWGSLGTCILHCYALVFLIVESYTFLCRPFWDVLFSVPSLQIQLYSCCFNHSSGFGSVGGTCVTMFIVMVFLLWLDSCRCLYMGLCSSVRCSISLCLQARCVYPT